MNYITVAKLQNKLEGEASQATVRKLIDKMTKDGFVEAGSNRRLGKYMQQQSNFLTKVKMLSLTDICLLSQASE